MNLLKSIIDMKIEKIKGKSLVSDPSYHTTSVASHRVLDSQGGRVLLDVEVVLGSGERGRSRSLESAQSPQASVAQRVFPGGCLVRSVARSLVHGGECWWPWCGRCFVPSTVTEQ